MSELPTAEGKKMFTWVWGKNYLALPRDPQPWLIDKLVPAGGLMNLYSSPKIGKSFLALGFALAVSNADVGEFAGHKVLKHGPVMYLQIDTPRNQWAKRIDDIKDDYVIDNIAFIDANLTPYPMDINQDAVRDALREDVLEIKPAMLVVDTLREVHDGDENDSGGMKKVITALVQCTKDTNTTLLLVSHSRKDTVLVKNGKKIEMDEEIGLMDDGRGSSYVSGRMDVVSKLSNKGLRLKGRSIGNTTLPLTQNPITGLWEPNVEKATQDAHLKFVCSQANLSQRDMAQMLITFQPELKLEAARSRVRKWIEENGGTSGNQAANS